MRPRMTIRESKGEVNKLYKVGSYIGKFKNTLSNFQKEVSSITNEIDVDEEIVSEDKNNKKDG